MEWNQLSNEAKNVIEWLESPFTGRHNTIEIEVGKPFIATQTNVMITQKLFNEITKYVMQDENIKVNPSEFENKLSFEFSDEFKSKNKS